MSRGMPHAAIVLSGNELLDGRTRDTNGAFLSSELSAHGVKVTSVVIVCDDDERLEAALRFALAAAPDLVVVGGGLGTTHDDLTAACLARVLGVPLVEHPEALTMVSEKARQVAARRHLDFDDVFPLARRQALLPAGSMPVRPAGLAPGIAAHRGDTRIFAFPGVPWEFESMWRHVFELLAADGFFPHVVTRTVRIYGAGELQVGPVLDSVSRDRLETGITVGRGEVEVRLRYARTSAAATAQADALVAALKAAMPVFSSDGRTVDDLVADGLRSAGATVAVAESCTGGLLGGRITARPGSSDYFLGGVICYADAAKIDLLRVPPGMLAECGAVSEEVAGAMAEGAREATGATFGLGVTGVAGPDGGTADKPVGLVYVSCSGPRGTRVSRGDYPGDRESVRAWSVSRTLHLLREALEP